MVSLVILIPSSKHEPRYLGSTKLRLGRLGLGLAPLGNLYASVSDADAEETLAAAVQHGISWFDVAPLYGYGLAEERLGRFLEHAKRAEPTIISTKVGRILEPTFSVESHEHFVGPHACRVVFDYTRAGIERSYEDSLRRLGRDRVHLLLLHDIDRLTHPEGHRILVKTVLDEALPTLHRLKSDGRVDAIGLGLNEWDIAYEVLAGAEIDCVLLAGRHTLLDQTAFTSGFLDSCASKRVSVLAGGVFSSGFLAGGSNYGYRPASESLIRQRSALISICQRHGIPLAAAALQFSAAHPAITSVVVGARSAEEVKMIVEWTRATIPAELWDELRAGGLIAVDAPTPDGAWIPTCG
jgi:D-threo-aldose 1-dehydrogenase